MRSHRFARRTADVKFLVQQIGRYAAIGQFGEIFTVLLDAANTQAMLRAVLQVQFDQFGEGQAADLCWFVRCEISNRGRTTLLVPRRSESLQPLSQLVPYCVGRVEIRAGCIHQWFHLTSSAVSGSGMGLALSVLPCPLYCVSTDGRRQCHPTLDTALNEKKLRLRQGNFWVSEIA